MISRRNTELKGIYVYSRRILRGLVSSQAEVEVLIVRHDRLRNFRLPLIRYASKIRHSKRLLAIRVGLTSHHQGEEQKGHAPNKLGSKSTHDFSGRNRPMTEAEGNCFERPRVIAGIAESEKTDLTRLSSLTSRRN